MVRTGRMSALVSCLLWQATSNTMNAMKPLLATINVVFIVVLALQGSQGVEVGVPRVRNHASTVLYQGWRVCGSRSTSKLLDTLSVSVKSTRNVKVACACDSSALSEAS